MALPSDCEGGGIYNAYFMIVTNSTGVDSAITGIGGGIYSVNRDSYLGNTIVAGNTANTTLYGRDYFGTVDSQGNNLIGETDGSNGWNGTDLKGTYASPLDPGLGPLADNGGPTWTMALLAGSPAIDAGSNTVQDVPSTDRAAPCGPAGRNAVFGGYRSLRSQLVVRTLTVGHGEPGQGIHPRRRTVGRRGHPRGYK